MKLAIRNVGGIDRADVTLSPTITMIAGVNGAGKTTLIRSLGAALAAMPIPIEKLAKKNAIHLVRDGAKTGSVTVEGDTGKVSITYAPEKADLSTTGTPPAISAIVAGLADLCDDKPEERARILSELMKADPTKEDLALALADAAIPKERIDEIWTDIDRQGWTAAHALHKEQGAKLKGRWEQITGQRYGKQAALEWEHPDWSAGLGTETEDSLRAKVGEAKSAHDEAVAATAVDAAARGKLQEAADTKPQAQRRVDEAKANLTAADAAVTDAEAARSNLPSPEVPKPQERDKCPHCGGEVMIRQNHVLGIKQTHTAYRLEKIAPLSGDEQKNRRIAIADADGTLSNRLAAQAEARQTLARAEADLAAAERAAADLAKLADGGDVDPQAVARAKEALDIAQRQLEAFRATTAAAIAATAITAQIVIVEALAPDGVKAKKAQQTLDLFNGRLSVITKDTGWKSTAVTPDFTVTYGGRDFRLCSLSEQWRARVTLRLSIAILQGARLVLIDGADILDAEGKNDLLAILLDNARIPAVVGMTFGDRGKAIDLAKHDMGATWWVEKGTAAPLAQQKAAA